jgi:DNA-binding PadR family transcriptional regulator
MENKPKTKNIHDKPNALTKADLIVLSLLAERSMNGYELVGEYERQEVSDWASVSKAQVYYAIQKLLAAQMIRAITQVKEQSARDRTVYEPTKNGRKELVKSLLSKQWAQARIAQPFATWLGLSIHLSAEEIRQILAAREQFLIKEIEREKKSLAYIETLKSSRAKVGHSIVRLVISQFEVELSWIESLYKTHSI